MKEKRMMHIPGEGAKNNIKRVIYVSESELSLFKCASSQFFMPYLDISYVKTTQVL